ncbi:solute carrier family 41 member 1 isoform X2 [Pseudomyrmex gracilis]|nr:solute carrier family 41 member 1 isoform X2 [Pseudomyrmex gracilis]
MHSNNQTKKDKSMTGGDGGNGSLSSGSSLATIASIAITDPDPNYHHNDLGGSGNEKNIRNEKWYHTILQVSVPFFIAGMGTIGAGRVLTSAKDLPAFKEVPQLMILTTALQGLKGNLDMCLASRLCTQANLGNMTSRREIAKMIIGNIALVQIQAIVAAMCLSLFGMGVGTLNENGAWAWDRALLLAVSCMCTATSSCFILDFVMIAVIMISYRYKMNPDNVATPLAASIGDVVSISILSVIASQFFLKLNNEIWVLYVVLAIFVVLLPVWILIVLKNKYTRSVLKSGWVPILSALLISGGGGLVLEKMIDMYEGPEVFQPVINGIGGNLVSVHASRMSTMLHQSSIMGILPPHGKIWVFPWTALFVGSPYAKVARLLVALAIPGQLVFVFIADALNPGNCTLHVYFVLSYIIVSVVQVMILLYVAHIIIHAMWRFKIDPDNSAIPYLTALGDLSGSLLLALAFFFMDKINRPYCTE